MWRVLHSTSLLLAWAILWAAPAWSGIHFKSVTTTEEENGETETTEVEAWVSGEKAKVVFQESGNPMAPSGTYLVTQDGGKILYLVNPEEKTYAEWNLDALAQFAGGVMEGMRGMFSITFTEPKVEKLLEANGGMVAGVPTRHYRYRTSYSMEMKFLGRGRSSDIVTEQDIWATTALGDAALGVWLRKEPLPTGDEELDALIAAEMGKVEGFPVKTVSVTTTTSGKKGKQTVTRSIMEVTELERVSVADSTFEIPAGYEKVEMMPAMEGGEEDEAGSPFQKLFGKKDG